MHSARYQMSTNKCAVTYSKIIDHETHLYIVISYGKTSYKHKALYYLFQETYSPVSFNISCTWVRNFISNWMKWDDVIEKETWVLMYVYLVTARSDTSTVQLRGCTTKRSTDSTKQGTSALTSPVLYLNCGHISFHRFHSFSSNFEIIQVPKFIFYKIFTLSDSITCFTL